MIQAKPNPKREIDAPAKERIRCLYDRVARRRGRFRRLNSYYHRELLRMLKFIIPEGKRILEIGCGDGWLMRELKPSFGLGVDISPEMVRCAREEAQPEEPLQFEVADIETVSFTEKFDFVVMSDLIGNLMDVQQALENVRSACHDKTRIVINYHSILWEPVLKLAARLSLKMPNQHQNWISLADMQHFVTLSDLELVSHRQRMLMPKRIPLVSRFMNGCLARLPLVNRLGLMHLLVLRKREAPPIRERSVTVLIPCRNERGNVRPAIERLPAFGTSQEIIFVDGHSTDGTVEEIREVMAERTDKDIKLFIQPGRGKGDAVRMGFARASNEVLMILDADLTVPPEDLPKFYDAIARNKGDFINGSRLVYPMETEAMRFLNILGNKGFSVALSSLLGQPLKDTLCGTKVLVKSDYDRISANRSYFGDFDPFGDFDLLFGASKLNMKILEIPIRYRERTYGSTNISRFRHGWLLLKMTAFAATKYI